MIEKDKFCAYCGSLFEGRDVIVMCGYCAERTHSDCIEAHVKAEHPHKEKAAHCSRSGKEKTMMGKKYDTGKDDWSVLPWPQMRDVVRVFMHGVDKYGRHNYLTLDEWARRYWNAAQRHLMSIHAGEWSDQESGLPHYAHAVASLLMLGACGRRYGTPGPIETEDDIEEG